MRIPVDEDEGGDGDHTPVEYQHLGAWRTSICHTVDDPISIWLT